VNRGSARDRDLLRYDDLRQPGKAARAAPQRRPPGALRHGGPARIARDERRDSRIEVRFGMNMRGHRLED